MEILVFEQDAVLESLVLALDLALGLRMHGRTPRVIHALFTQPSRQIGRNVRRTVLTG